MACYVTRPFLFIYIQREKKGIKTIKYHMDIGSLAACMKRIMESRKWLGERYFKSAMVDFFLSDSWFAPNRLAESEIDIGADMVGMVKTITEIFYKTTINNLKKY